MIKTSCGNKSDFDLIASALLDQHPNIENRERRNARSEETRQGKGSRPAWKKPYFKKTAYQAVDDHDISSDVSSDYGYAHNAMDEEDGHQYEISPRVCFGVFDFLNIFICFLTQLGTYV